MPKIMNMPKIGVNMTEALIIEWVVKEGDIISEGDHILDAETDKAAQEIFSSASGVLVKILAKEGDKVLCQSPIAIIAEPGEKVNDDMTIKTGGKGEESSKGPLKQEEPAKAAENKAVELVRQDVQTDRVRISPLAKKMAKDNGIDYKQIRPSTPGARIVKADVIGFMTKMAAKSTVSANVPDDVASTIPYTGIRKTIGDRMAESSSTKPCAALTLHADASGIIEWRNRLKKSGKTVSYNDILTVITAKALKEFPIMNSKLSGNEIQILRNINIGTAVDTEKGLLVPVVKNADKKGLLEISRESRDKLEKIRDGKASLEDLTGGTFTITNLGMYEIEQFVPVINPPECCILAVGAIVREPVVDECDNIVIKSRMQLTLAFDHRIVDGAPAARFLQRIKQLIEWPMELVN